MRLHSAMFTGIFAADERVKKALTARAKVVKKSHMRKGYAIFLFGCVLFEEVVSCMQEVVSLREVFRLWRVTATK